MRRRTHIIIAEPSVIIRSGIVSVLKRLNALDVDIAEIPHIESLSAQICKHNPDIVIINPAYLGMFSLQQVKSGIGCADVKIVALMNTLSDDAALKHYDEVISIYDSANTIKEKLTALIKSKNKPDDKLELSTREQEVVVCIAKGLSNKQIAEHLCLSTHTVMTHRRNITGKLQIHSPAGLTIYAIVNKLIDIQEVKELITSGDPSE